MNSTTSVWILFIFNQNSLFLSNRVNWDTREKVLKDAKSIFQRSFHGRCRYRIVRSLLQTELAFIMHRRLWNMDHASCFTRATFIEIGVTVYFCWSGLLYILRSAAYSFAVLRSLNVNLYTNTLAKIQVSAAFHMRDIWRSDLPKFIELDISSRGGTGYAVSLRGNFINLRGYKLTQMTSCISLS